MVKVIYETPRKDWIVCLQHNEAWIQTFATEPFYMVCKYDPIPYILPDGYSDTAKNYRPVVFAKEVAEAFSFLRKNNIISKDEEKFNVERLKCPEVLSDTIKLISPNIESQK